jgi:hypothetical protein
VTVKWDGGWLQADHLAALVEMGLDGLEIYHTLIHPLGYGMMGV